MKTSRERLRLRNKFRGLLLLRFVENRAFSERLMAPQLIVEIF